MRKLNRSKLLGLVTAGAIVVTTAFSFAAWATTTSKVSKSITFDKPVNITAQLNAMTPTGNKWSTTDTPTYAGTVVFDVENVQTGEATIDLTKILASDANGTAITTGETMAVYKGSDTTTPISDVALTNIPVTEGENSFHIVVTADPSQAVATSTIFAGLEGSLKQVSP